MAGDRTAFSLKRRVVTAIALAALVMGSFAGTATALDNVGYWNKSATPLVVTGYGSTARAYGYYTIKNGSNGTRAYNYAWNKFVDGDNHKAYLLAESWFNAGSCRSESSSVRIYGVDVSSSSNCAQQFYHYRDFGRADGLNKTVSTWTAMPTRSTGFKEGADRGKALVKLCIDIPWRTDKCTGKSNSAFDTF